MHTVAVYSVVVYYFDVCAPIFSSYSLYLKFYLLRFAIIQGASARHKRGVQRARSDGDDETAVGQAADQARYSAAGCLPHHHSRTASQRYVLMTSPPRCGIHVFAHFTLRRLCDINETHL